MLIDSVAGHIELLNETNYTFDSPDNLRQYPFSKHLDNQYKATSIHGVLLNGEPLAVIGDSGGCSVVHSHSAIALGDQLFLAVGRHVVCIQLTPFKLKWVLKTDSATCFGIYYDKMHHALISHGELEIARFTEDGRLLWSVGGADIFTGGFLLDSQFIEIRDFEGRVYQINYSNGQSLPEL